MMSWLSCSSLAMQAQPGGAAAPNPRAEPRVPPMAETLLPAWSQQGSSLPQSWNGDSLHG